MKDRIEPVLADALSQLAHEPDADVIDRLAKRLAPLHDEAKAGGALDEFRRVCQEHQLAQIILEDPYSRRAFEKPRGYAGDAVMLDYIYKAGNVEASPLGMAIHKATTTLPNARSILWRRDYLASTICNLMETKPFCRVLAVASGHMRELGQVRKNTIARNIEFWALDQDQQSLEESLRSYPDFTIRPINKAVFYLFKTESLTSEKFDFIYSAGLADYLPDKTLEALLRRLFSYLKTGGLLSIGNFTPDSHGRAFMEGFMNWSLIYRDEADLLRIAEGAAPLASYKVFRDEPNNVAYIEVKNSDQAV
jgi:extracellular factor (EF) 3-hydroxypalmitic acid methyl ester biosynthesis protein